MSDLLAAAKAVIEYWDADATDNLQDEVIDKLRAAVEQSERQGVVGFEEWWDSIGKHYWPYEYLATHDAWTAAQQAERERCREIVITMGGPDVPELLRQIDSGEE